MKAEIEAFVLEMNNQLREGQRLTYLPRDRLLQLAAVKSLEALKTEAGLLKEKAVLSQDENAANAMLSYENVVQTLISELSMWVALKDDNAHAAWNYLVDAQGAAMHAVRAHQVGEHMAHYAKRLEGIEHLVFPPQMFTSPGLVVEDAECSICKQRYGDCEHVKAKPYMGEFCQRIITKMRFTELSSVDDPADKRCITLSHSSDGKNFVDWMTHRQIEVDSPDAESEPEADNTMDQGTS